MKWKAWLGLALVYVSLLTGIYSLWAMVLIAWVIGDLRARETWFLETVPRATHPVTYWALLLSWTAFSILLLAFDVMVLWGGQWWR